jgi:lysophospholipase L1-like esterase
MRALLVGLWVAVASAAPGLARSPIRLLTLGDSFTEGTGSRADQSFPARLAARWRASGRAVELKNLGVNGYSTLELIEEELPQVRAFAPTRVTLAVGANDIVRHPGLNEYRRHLRQIFAALVDAGVPGSRIWVLPQPYWALSPAAADFGSPEAIAATIESYNAALRQEAEGAGATYVDLWALMKREARAGKVANDGLHPSAEAYDEWAGELARLQP